MTRKTGSGENAELYGKAELDVRKLPSTQESADAILSNEQAKADFQKLFGVKLEGDYAKQSATIIEQLDYWWMANYKTQEQESATQQVERWNAEQTAQNAANVQQNTGYAANVQQNAENSQVNIDNAANSGYNETKTQESGGVSDVGNGVDSRVDSGVSLRQGTGAEMSGSWGHGRADQVVSGGALSESLRNAMKNSGVVPTELHDFGSDIAAFSSALDEGQHPRRPIFCRDGACPIRDGTFIMQNADEN